MLLILPSSIDALLNVSAAPFYLYGNFGMPFDLMVLNVIMLGLGSA